MLINPSLYCVVLWVRSNKFNTFDTFNHPLLNANLWRPIAWITVWFWIKVHHLLVRPRPLKPNYKCTIASVVLENVKWEQNTFTIVFTTHATYCLPKEMFFSSICVLFDFKLYNCVDLSQDGHPIRSGYDRLLCSIFVQISGCLYIQKM